MIYKKLDGNKFEKDVFDRFPTLKEKVVDLNHNDTFQIDEDFEMKALYTPGHASDHISLLLKPLPQSKLPEEPILFSGDIILGTPSTSV
jgi:glyoxylase-like metal-dependent hydrolase (beta-lactamase superfamily II)